MRLTQRTHLSLIVGFLMIGNLTPLTAADVSFEDPATVDSFLDNARDVVMTDWDLDGDLDLIAASFDTGEISLYRTQQFGYVASSWPLGGDAANALAVGDIDGNGQPDLLYAMGDTSGSADRVGVVLNRASDFLVTVDDTGLGNPQGVALGDLDSDGDLDAVACELGADRVVWYENVNGDGETWTERVVVSGVGDPSDVIAHDVDRDGDLDLVVASFSRIAWLENRLDQNPSTWLSHTVDSTVVAASSVAVADVDGNGETEIVSGCINSPLLAWWGRPTVLTNPWTRHEIQNSDKITDVSVVDLDADGDQDIISSRWNASSGGLTLWENTGGAAFVDRELGGVYFRVWATAVGDIDTDGDLDFAVATGDSDLVEVMENVTIHSTADVTIVASKSAEGALPRPMDLGVTDLDRDGDLDIVSYDDTHRLHWRDMPDDAPTLLQATSAVLNSDAFELADIDNDGDTDVVMGLSDGLEWLENPGFGNQFARHTIDSASTIEHVTVVDLNGDGQLDVIGLNSATTEVRWWRNLGEGSGWFENPLATGLTSFSDLAIGDLDRDGAVEVVIVADGEVTAYSRLTDTVFNQSIVATADPSIVVIGDFDVDGDPDVLGLIDGPAPDIALWINDGAGGTWTEETSPFASAVLDLVVGDLDLDGDPDLYAPMGMRSLAAYNVTNGGSPLAFRKITNQGLPTNRTVLADFDGDGDPDVVAIPRSGSDAVVVAENRRGQFGSSVGYASAQLTEGTTGELAVLTVEHLGRPGDQDVRLMEVRIEFTTVDGVPLTGAQIDGLFERVFLYRTQSPAGDLAPVFDPDEPGAVVLDATNGSTLSLIPPPVNTVQSSTVEYRIRADLEPDAAATLTEFRIRFDTEDDPIRAQDELGAELRSQPMLGRVYGVTVNSSFDPEIFSDGFESSDLSAWSSSVN
jgi:hypothetical protein